MVLYSIDRTCFLREKRLSDNISPKLDLAENNLTYILGPASENVVFWGGFVPASPIGGFRKMVEKK